jgi:hypothetical protein
MTLTKEHLIGSIRNRYGFSKKMPVAVRDLVYPDRLKAPYPVTLTDTCNGSVQDIGKGGLEMRRIFAAAFWVINWQ